MDNYIDRWTLIDDDVDDESQSSGWLLGCCGDGDK